MEKEQKSHSDTVRLVMQTYFGSEGALTVLYYAGEPDSSTFEGKLRSFLGSGAEVLIQEIKKRSSAQGP